MVAAGCIVEIDGKQPRRIDLVKEGRRVHTDLCPGVARKFTQQRIGRTRAAAENADLGVLTRHDKVHPEFDGIEIRVAFDALTGREVDIHPQVIPDIASVNGKILARIGAIFGSARSDNKPLRRHTACRHKGDLGSGVEHLRREHFARQNGLIDHKGARHRPALAVRLGRGDRELVAAELFGLEVIPALALGERNFFLFRSVHKVERDGNIGTALCKVGHGEGGKAVFHVEDARIRLVDGDLGRGVVRHVERDDALRHIPRRDHRIGDGVAGDVGDVEPVVEHGDRAAVLGKDFRAQAISGAVLRFHVGFERIYAAELCRLGRFRREVLECERVFLFPARRQPEAERDGKHECSRKQ